MGFDLESSDILNFKKMQDNFPTEIDLCGLFKFGECSDTEAHMQEILSCIDITDNPILLKCSHNGDDLKASQYRNGKLENIDYEIISEDILYRQFFYARLLGYVEVPIDSNEKSIKHEFLNVRKKLASGNVIFRCQNQSIFFDTNNVIGMNQESVMLDLLDMIKEKKEDGKKSKKDQAPFDFTTININCLIKKSDENEKNNRATLNFILERNRHLVPIKIDTLAALHISTKTIALYDILVESLCRTLRLVEENVLEQFDHSGKISIPSTFHFKPDNFGHFYTCIYADSVPDDEKRLVSIRRELHQQLGIPFTRPVFRRTNNYNFNDLRSSLLVNPHVGLKSTVIGGKQSLVQGKYTYHHYMQDNFNDDGWGCAYRSLQTLCSWFRFQGYSTSKIPSHEEIQRYLVKIGDKPQNFINSRQWIGSTEVSMCLNGFMKVDSRIMHVSSGAELASKGSELAYHFESQGTPIMIGGGVLAHTILGVDFNSNTGELKFLILDPHYTGADDIQTVQNKGWCGWKNTSFWDKASYYNLCMPQRPVMF